MKKPKLIFCIFFIYYRKKKKKDLTCRHIITLAVRDFAKFFGDCKILFLLNNLEEDFEDAIMKCNAEKKHKGAKTRPYNICRLCRLQSQRDLCFVEKCRKDNEIACIECYLIGLLEKKAWKYM